MKRYIDFVGNSALGGAPFFNEDFYDIQQEFYDVINPTIQNLGKQITSNGNYVVSGCEVSANGPNYDIAEGIVSLGGELYRFNGQTSVSSGNKFIAIASNAIETRVYQSNATQPFFETKQAEILSSSSGGSEIQFDPSDSEVFKRLSNPIRTDGNWNNITLKTGVSVVSGQTAQYRITADESIELRGILSFASTSSINLFDLPTDYGFGGNLDFIAIPCSGLGSETGTFLINGLGQCLASYSLSAPTTRIQLFGIRWSKPL